MFTSTSAETLYPAGGTGRDGVSGEAPPRIVTRTATARDIAAYYGGPPEHTLRAFVAELDGEIVGAIGIAREGGIGKFFCDFKPALSPYLRSMAIMRLIKASMRLVEGYRGPVGAIAEHAEGCRMLYRLGFTHIQGELYAWLE